MEYLRQGQKDALSVLFDRHYRLVFSVAIRILHDHGEAEDLMQEVFLEILRKIEQYNPAKGSAKTWILQYAYHRSLNRQKYLNLRNFYDGHEAGLAAEWDPKQASDNWDGLAFSDWASIIEKGFTRLSDKEKTAIHKAYYQGMLLKEIAAQMNEPVANVRNHYYRGLKKLREFLKEQENLGQKRA
ncbi:MAG: sigma-70 family RNA polymerase sigma factor [Terriglobia bacterium]